MTTQRTRQVVEEDGHDHDAGLSLDLPTMITRRRALGLAALGGLTTILAACGSGDGGAAGATTSARAATTTAGTTSSADASVAEADRRRRPAPTRRTARTGSTSSPRAGSCAPTSRQLRHRVGGGGAACRSRSR